MPAANAGRGGGAGGGGGAATGQRTVFRPPWVKDNTDAAAPPPPTGPPWRRQSRVAADEASAGSSATNNSTPAKGAEATAPGVEKKVKVVPIARPDEGKAAAESDGKRTRASGKPSAPEAKVIPIRMADDSASPGDKKAKVIPIQRVDSNAREDPPKSTRSRPTEASEAPQRGKFQRQETDRRSSGVREDAPVENGFPGNKERRTSQQAKPPPKAEPPLQRQLSQQRGRPEKGPPAGPPPPPPPPPPPMGPMGPPPPPMPTGDIKRVANTAEAKARLEALRSRPRRRPDWAEMMKEVEDGIKLKHVQCNDRSKPLLPQVKAKGQFVYETEQKNIHNQLLNQIQQGVKLKRTVTNDRSKPVLDGLRKFRRQLTIEEQIQQAEEEAVVEPDELDDIDKVRDDLQSTKQMLALELANKAQAERENRLLQAKVFAIEEQLEKERERAKKAEEERDRLKEATDCGIPGIGDPLDALRAQVALAGKTAYDYQQKYQDVCRRLELTKATLEDEEHKTLLLEKKLEAATKGKGGGGSLAPSCTIAVQTDPVVVVGSEVIPLTKQPSRKEIARAVAAAAAQQLPKQQQQDGKKEDGDEESEYTEESYSGSEEESEDEEAKEERRHQREMKMLASKLKSYREKEGSAKKERKALKEQHGRLTKTLKTEKTKYKKLQKEVDKMAKLMKEGDDDEEEEEEEEVEEEEEESSEEESSEEESSEEEDDVAIPQDDPKAPPEKKTFRFEQMIKRHESSLAALKKGNYMLKANIDRLKDELEKQKEMYVTLQEDLNSVLAELG
ncbi:calponin homology domain-containing protein DDB_G0272472-like isoform X2 [Hetaerina americana]